MMADDRWRAALAGQRKVRTPYGSMPRKIRGRRGSKIAATESVTENTPPVLWQQGKVRLKRRGKSSPLAE